MSHSIGTTHHVRLWPGETAAPRMSPRLAISKWATPDLRGESARVCVPPGTWVTGFAVRHQGGKGLTDLRLEFECSDGSGGWTEWAIGSDCGQCFSVHCGGRPYAMGLVARSQRWHGMINLRLIRAGGLGSRWAVANAAGELHWSGLRSGARAVGIELRHHHEYGLLNARPLAHRD